MASRPLIFEGITMTDPNTQNYSYDLDDNILYAGDKQIPAYELEENEIGSCGDCNSVITSLSYHELGGEFIIAGKCTNCRALSANVYDQNWNWVREIVVSLFLDQGHADDPDKMTEKRSDDGESGIAENSGVSDLELLNRIPMKQIETIFSPTEITAMFARAKGEKCIRQYLYNARKKYKTFEDVFGIKLDI